MVRHTYENNLTYADKDLSKYVVIIHRILTLQKLDNYITALQSVINIFSRRQIFYTLNWMKRCNKSKMLIAKRKTGCHCSVKWQMACATAVIFQTSLFKNHFRGTAQLIEYSTLSTVLCTLQLSLQSSRFPFKDKHLEWTKKILLEN